jgi:hypothetical protein
MSATAYVHSNSLDYRTKAGLLRGAGIEILPRRVFSYDVVTKDGVKLGHRHFYSLAMRLALSHVPREHLDNIHRETSISGI